MNRFFGALSLIVIFSSHSPAAILFDSGGFDAYAPAALVGQNGWQDFNSPLGNRYTVQNAVANGGQAVRVSSAGEPSSSSGIASFVAPAINYTPTANEIVRIEVDIARTVSGGAAVPGSEGFYVDIYDTPAGNRTASFGLAVNATNTVIVPFVTTFQAGNPNGQDLALSLTVQQNEFVRFRAELNYASDTFELFLNDLSVGGPFQFVTAAAALGDADLVQAPVVGAQDVGYFDNYRISTVPEPSSTVGCSIAFVGLLWRRRRRQASTMN